MQDRLEAEQQLRRRNEERLVQLQAEAQSLTQSLAQQHEELEQVTQAAVASAERKAKLQAEVQLSRQRLLEKASTLSCSVSSLAEGMASKNIHRLN